MEPDEVYMNDKRNNDNVSNQSTTIVNEIPERRLSNERMKPTTPIKDLTTQNHNNANHSTNNMLSNYADKFNSQRTSTSEFDTENRRTSKQDKEVDIFIVALITFVIKCNMYN